MSSDKKTSQIEAITNVLGGLGYNVRKAEVNKMLAQKEIRKFREIEETQDSIIRYAAADKKLLEEMLLVLAGVNPLVEELREKIMAAEKDAARRDITVAKASSLEAETACLKEQLKKLCCHTFVVSYDGYRGSYAYDYENLRYGHRVCAVCEFRENSVSAKEDIYEILNDDSSRIVRRTVFLEETPVLRGKGQVVVWQPTENIINAFSPPAARISEIIFAMKSGYYDFCKKRDDAFDAIFKHR